MHVIRTLVMSIEVFFSVYEPYYVVSYNIMHYLKIALMTFATEYIMKFDCWIFSASDSLSEIKPRVK